MERVKPLSSTFHLYLTTTVAEHFPNKKLPLCSRFTLCLLGLLELQMTLAAFSGYAGGHPWNRMVGLGCSSVPAFPPSVGRINLSLCKLY